MAEVLTKSQVAVIFAATEGMMTYAELLVKARKYPNMTDAEADAMVDETNNRAKDTIADWKAFRNG